jgi:predicted nucleic acid-binding protein
MDHLRDEAAIVPSIWPLEIGNALLMCERRKRISSEDISACLDDLSSMPIQTEAAASLSDLPLLIMMAREYRLTGYDTVYLEMAIRTGSTLATLDKDLRRAAHNANVPVLE